MLKPRWRRRWCSGCSRRCSPTTSTRPGGQTRATSRLTEMPRSGWVHYNLGKLDIHIDERKVAALCSISIAESSCRSFLQYYPSALSIHLPNFIPFVSHQVLKWPFGISSFREDSWLFHQSFKILCSKYVILISNLVVIIETNKKQNFEFRLCFREYWSWPRARRCTSTDFVPPVSSVNRCGRNIAQYVIDVWQSLTTTVRG